MLICFAFQTSLPAPGCMCPVLPLTALTAECFGETSVDTQGFLATGPQSGFIFPFPLLKRMVLRAPVPHRTQGMVKYYAVGHELAQQCHLPAFLLALPTLCGLELSREANGPGWCS